MPMTAKRMIKLLKDNGFVFVSSNGSHQKFKHPESKRVAIVPVHSKDLKPGTEVSILKQAGLR